MSKQLWGTRKTRAITAEVIANHDGVCHLCGKPGADTADHIIPKSVAPELMYVVDMMRPAHRRCNAMRGVMPLAEWYARHPLPGDARANSVEPSREW